MASKTGCWQISTERFAPRRFLAELSSDLKFWLSERGLWWGTSLVVHALILSTMLLLLGTFGDLPAVPNDLVAIVSEPIELHDEEEVPIIETPVEPPPLDTHFDLTSPDLPPGETLNPDDAASAPGNDVGDSVQPGDDMKTLVMPDLNHTAIGKIVSIVGGDKGPVGPRPRIPGVYSNRMPGNGGGPRFGVPDRTKAGDRAIAGALRWIARHQNPDGSWSIDAFAARCKSAACSGQGSVHADAAATALSLLPFLAAGQTHLTAAPADKQGTNYRAAVHAAAYWLMSHQKQDGDLSAGSDQVMYSHGLATIALAELFALSHDKQVGSSAQRAVEFIVAAQHPETGGWRYRPGERGDTSVAGWQIMALKSAQIAGLAVPSRTMELAQRWLRSASAGQSGAYSYEPGGGATSTMTAVGLLATQYLGARRQDPAMQEGVRYLMDHLPTVEVRNAYYWYYATQVLHNLPGPEWDTWNRRIRRILIDSQSTSAGLCSEGSWDPAQPTQDAWGQHGGRLMVTCLNCLTLQVYYRYLPLYQLDAGSAAQ